MLLPVSLSKPNVNLISNYYGDRSPDGRSLFLTTTEDKQFLSMKYSYDDSRNLRLAVQNIDDIGDVRQFLIDLKEYLDERACDFKSDMNTRDNNDALIDLLDYLKNQAKAQIEVVQFLKRFPPQIKP